MEIYEALRESRNVSGKSQEYMAFELGVARKTVQNWEKGISEPSLGQALEWFKAISINPLPYIFQVVYEDMDGINAKDDISKLKQFLTKLLDDLPDEGVRQLLYLFYGDHGSSPRAVLNMVTAHLQTPMKDRVSQGHIILKNYEIARVKGVSTSYEHVQPNVELLRDAIAKGEEAYINGVEAYILDESPKDGK